MVTVGWFEIQIFKFQTQRKVGWRAVGNGSSTTLHHHDQSARCHSVSHALMIPIPSMPYVVASNTYECQIVDGLLRNVQVRTSSPSRQVEACSMFNASIGEALETD